MHRGGSGVRRRIQAGVNAWRGVGGTSSDTSGGECMEGGSGVRRRIQAGVNAWRGVGGTLSDTSGGECMEGGRGYVVGYKRG